MNDFGRDQVARLLDAAIENAAAARVALGFDVGQEPPCDALDLALGRDEAAQEARRAVLEAVEALTVVQGPERRQAAFYNAEAAVNVLVSRVLEVGWRVGVLQGRRSS